MSKTELHTIYLGLAVVLGFYIFRQKNPAATATSGSSNFYKSFEQAAPATLTQDIPNLFTGGFVANGDAFGDTFPSSDSIGTPDLSNYQVP